MYFLYTYIGSMSTLLLVFILVVALAVLILGTRCSPTTAVGGGLLAAAMIGGAKRIQAMGPRDNLKPHGNVVLKAAPAVDFAAVIEAAKPAPGNYAPLTDAETKKLGAVAKKLGVSLSMLVSARNILASQAVADRVPAVIEAADKISALNADGKSILEIAAELGMPPISVARQLLLNEGKSLNEARSIITDPTMEHKLRVGIDEAAAADVSGRASMKVIADAAGVFEKRVADELSAAGVKWIGEEKLREVQTANPKLGRPVATPDFFFETPIMLNGKTVNWIDAKDYPLFAGPDVMPRYYKSLVRQAEKYNGHFGRGAFVFNGGMIDGATLLNKQGVAVDVDLCSL